MKQQNIKFLLALLMSMVGIQASAHDIEVANSDGKTIYYNFVNKNTELAVSHQGSYDYSYSNEYSGNIVIPETVTYNGKTYPVTSIGNGAFSSCSGLTKVTIPNSVTCIGNGAFSSCSGLTSVNIPNSVTNIESAAFQLCSGLTNINIGNSVTSIGGLAFSFCSGLTSINIPNSVTSIGQSAFDSCSGLTSITIPNSVTSIGQSAFSSCSGLTSITIPNSVTSIGRSAFLGCSGVKSITIPNSVTSIGSYAFARCEVLTNITIPNSVTTINDNTFKNCSKLRSVVLPNQLRIIQANAFDGCSKLESLNIPASVEYIYQSAFAGCSSLQSVTAQPTTPPSLYDNSFSKYSIPLNVPSGCKEAYQSAQGWRNFTTINDGNVYYQMSIESQGQGKVSYGTTEVTNGQKTVDVKEGTDAVLTLTPIDGFKVDKVMVNGEDRTAGVVNGQLTLSNVTANQTVSVSFGVAGEFTKVTIGVDKVATFCAAADVDFSTLNLKAYTGGGFNRQTGVLTMMRVYDVPAGTGLLLKGEPGTYFVPYSQSYSIYSNLLKGVTTETNLAATTGGYVNYVLASGTNGTGFYRVPAEGTTLAAGRAYLTIPAETAASRSALRLAFDDEDEATGISASLTNSEERIENSAVYDLQGRRVEQPQPGLYIRNGKKVIIK